MAAQVHTIAFEGIEAREVSVQVATVNGLPSFQIVGLGDKAVTESKERVRAALAAIGLGLPSMHLTVNLAPADLPKEGSHYDLPIALGLLTAMEVLPREALERFTAIGELALDGTISPVAGALPAAIAANGAGRGLICPQACGPEAAWAGDMEILAPRSIIALVNHFKGAQVLSPPKRGTKATGTVCPDFSEVKGQESAKRAAEVAAAGGHNLLMMGPPGSGKSMLAQRMPGILPPLTSEEMLEVSMIQSVAGLIEKGQIGSDRPYRAPHHSASMAAMIGGGLRVKPGEVSLAHLGVLFLDELPEFARPVLESLRQPIETGKAVIARANAHVSYPAKFQLVAAMNPCRCGYATDLGRACSRGKNCISDYQAKFSGPLMDRIDIQIELQPVSAADLSCPPPSEGSPEIAERVANARAAQTERFKNLGLTGIRTNADADGALLENIATPDTPGKALLTQAADALRLTARGYHRVLRVARTLADLEGKDAVGRVHIAEAVAYRQMSAAPHAPGPHLRALNEHPTKPGLRRKVSVS